MRKFAIALVISLAACGARQKPNDGEPAKSGSAELPDGPITLNFAPPADVQGTLSLHGITETEGRTTKLRVTYPLSTRATADGVIFEYGEPEHVETTLTEQQQAMLLPTITAVPTIVIDDGAVTAIHGFEELRARLEELLAPTYKKLPMMKPQMEAMMTAELFLASAQEEWAWRGQAFHGRTLEVGESVEENTELTMMLAKEKIPAKVVMTLAEVLPCPGAAERACVRLERERVIDSAKAKEAMGDLGKAFDLEKSTTSTLIADAETLLPYRFEKNERTKVTITRGDLAQEQTERKHVVETYTW